jgi:hypothetical protein
MNGLQKSFAGTALILMLSLATKSQTVSITYPNGQTRSVDCSLLYKENGKLYLTREATTALDLNKTPIGTSVNDLSKNPTERLQQLSQNNYLFLVHVARMHKDCVIVTANVEEKMGIKVDEIYSKLYGEKWRETLKNGGCTVLSYRDQCKQAMHL